MWIVLNNKPVNVFEIKKITSIHKITYEEVSLIENKKPEDYPVYFFSIDGIHSKLYKTFEEAERVRNEMLSMINTMAVSSLPKINF